jgi:hypothetical protein
MESVILDPLEYRIDRPSLPARLRLKEGSGHAEKVEGLIREAEAVAHPRAIYRMAFIESRGDRHVVAEGLRFESRVLKVNLDNLHRFFAFVVTSGRELDAWANAKTDLLERFWADAINQAVVISARSFLDRHLQEHFGLAKTARMSPGSLPDWPLEEQRVLFELLGDTRKAIGVELTESLFMVPVKSVSGIIFANEEGFASCQLCPREDCPGRKAPYDPGLYERKYRDPSQTSHLGQSS